MEGLRVLPSVANVTSLRVTVRAGDRGNLGLGHVDSENWLVGMDSVCFVDVRQPVCAAGSSIYSQCRIKTV